MPSLGFQLLDERERERAMASGEAEGEEGSLGFTPTWIVAIVCSLIVFVSFALERTLHYLGKHLKKTNRKPLFEALLKVKEELMLLGFISLLLTVFQGPINHVCIPKRLVIHMLPCQRKSLSEEIHHSQVLDPSHLVEGKRHLLAIGDNANHCVLQGKVHLLSLEAIHQLHIFIFVLAIVQVIFSVLTMILGGIKICQWKCWEDSIQNDKFNVQEALEKKVIRVEYNSFIKEHTSTLSRHLSWLVSFFKQFYASVTESDYCTLRLGFIMTHCKGNPKFNFYKYMMRALEADFKKVVGISWYLWVFVVIFLLLDVGGWHTYFWIAFIRLILLLAVGAKLENIITKLAQDVADKHTAIEGELVVRPSDAYFWFHRPRVILFLIHFILFQNAFEIAFLLWIMTTFGFDSCMMGQVGFIVPRIIIGALIQCVCSYSTLPLYALVTQMGTSFKKVIFEEHVQECLVDWAEKAKRRRRNQGEESSCADADDGGGEVHTLKVATAEAAMEDGVAKP